KNKHFSLKDVPVVVENNYSEIQKIKKLFKSKKEEELNLTKEFVTKLVKFLLPQDNFKQRVCYIVIILETWKLQLKEKKLITEKWWEIREEEIKIVKNLFFPEGQKLKLLSCRLAVFLEGKTTEEKEKYFFLVLKEIRERLTAL
ncbi:MAG: hypothetical protein PHG83_02540, partial [Patescibacteria group bacterium]|nr:hypothetical protein [Patescibacteria group bacterium]